jgi:hypothetical protein
MRDLSSWPHLAWGMLRARHPLPLLSLSVLLASCATGPSLQEAQPQRRGVRILAQQRYGPAPMKQASSPVGASALRPYLDFIQDKQQALKQSSPGQKAQQLEERVLWDMHLWALRQHEAALRRTTPLEVYVELKVARQLLEQSEAAHQAAVEAKLNAFLDWAEQRWAQVGREHVRALDSRHLLTEHPLRTHSQNALTAAVLDWAFTHSLDKDLLRKSPNEVALYLLARNSSLATAIELGRYAPAHLDYTPPQDTRPPPEELALEVLVGFLPIVGEATDAAGFFAGYSITGHELDADERLLCGVAMLLPFIPGRAPAGVDAVEHLALATGRGLNEVRVLQRVALHLSPAEASQVDVLMRRLSKGDTLSEQDVLFLRRVAAGLERPLLEAAQTLQRGGKVPLVGSRLGGAGMKLEPGTAEHMAAAWVDYQFRHPNKYPRFRYAMDDTWRKQYESILRNKEAGGGFELDVLAARKQEKNRALMMPSPGSRAQGFIPDAVPRNPTPGELVWGQPYHFVEAKGRKELSLSGNLKAMLEYVEKHGGQVELWIRSAKHAQGPTRLTSPLRELIATLADEGKVELKSFP